MAKGAKVFTVTLHPKAGESEVGFSWVEPHPGGGGALKAIGMSSFAEAKDTYQKLGGKPTWVLVRLEKQTYSPADIGITP